LGVKVVKVTRMPTKLTAAEREKGFCRRPLKGGYMERIIVN